MPVVSEIDLNVNVHMNSYMKSLYECMDSINNKLNRLIKVDESYESRPEKTHSEQGNNTSIQNSRFKL